MTTTTPAAVLVRSAEAEQLADGPTSLITLLADSADTGGAMTANRSLLKAGSPGAPAHFHTRASEVLFVLDGALRALAGDEVHDLGPGDFLLLPPGLPHAFAPVPGREADVLALFTPGLPRFDYYRLLARVAAGTASVDEIRASSERYDNHYVPSEAWAGALADR
ncbi:cupin domain-containing protein [Streptomyces hainanensis]|uniref:Cupin domain-containing protein n=1 Tax=Streptomyces hainanensis TaxID=402648 RepID=A0A4V2Y494_9ACTN|nr:cupin domain-containing protein [Streptomyces hainanensis]TDC79525.1 cupin domain-containing protein [Streptomyces hainanensis]